MRDIRKKEFERRTFLKSLGVAGLMVADIGDEAASQGASRSGPDHHLDGVEAGSVAGDVGRDNIPLDGTWQFQTDPQYSGLADGWYLPDKSFDGQIEVPGCWQAQGVGTPFSYFGQSYLRHDYMGWGWYKRDVAVPDSWRDRQVWLKISGVHRSARVFCNGAEVGYHDGFCSPFRTDVSSHIVAGGSNTIVILVDNTGGSKEKGPGYPVETSRPVGTFNYLGNWGGIWGHAELEATAKAWIDSVHVRTKVSPAAVTLNLVVAAKENFAPSGLRLHITIRSRDESERENYVAECPVEIKRNNRSSVSVNVPMADAEPWSPERPKLYVAQLRLLAGASVLESVQQKFGLREVTTKEGKIWLNGRPYYLVGYGDDSVEVIKGVPPVSLDEHRRRIQLAKSYGFNCVRFHSRVPPDEVFQAADEVGLFIQAELPVVYSEFLLPHLEFLWSELEGAMVAFRNHPSWISIALGNELIPFPGKETEFQKAFNEFHERAKRLNPDILALSSDGWTVPPSDLFSVHSGYVAGETTIAHEFGGYLCSLPDVSLAPRFTGVTEPFWLSSTASWLKKNNLDLVYPKLLESSQRMMIGEMRKFRIEELRRMPEIQGYDLWIMTDYPSGREGFLWESGLANYFWEPKALKPEEFSRFNSLNVIVSDTDISERTWWEGTAARVGFYSSYYGSTKLEDATLSYFLMADGNRASEGKKAGVRVSAGGITYLGDIEISVPVLGRPVEYTLEVVLSRGPETIARNSWTYWAYPRILLEKPVRPVVSRLPEKRVTTYYPFVESHRAAGPSDLLLVGRLEQPDFAAVLDGASAIILLEQNRGEAQRPFEFFPVFTLNGTPHSYGSRIEEHPIFRNFPNRGYFDAQFYNLVEGSFGLDPEINPMFEIGTPIQSVHPLAWCVWSSGVMAQGLKKLGFLYEFYAGRGKVIVSSFNFRRYLDDGYPSVVYLFDRLLRYAVGDEFRPAAAVSESQFSYFLRGSHG
jgi:hypothetical protein